MSSILYVDDEPSNLVVFESAFEDDFDVHTAASAREAIEILKQAPIDLLITDQRMPEMTGVQLLEAVSGDFPDLIRMILTGYSDVQAVIHAINTGRLDQYLTKPYDVEALGLTMARAIERKIARERNRALTDHLEAAARRARRVREVFQKHVPGPVVEALLSGRSDTLVGEHRIVVILFAEIIGFRRLAAELPPDRALGFVDAYFTEMDRIILAHNGFFATSACAEIFALFGVPLASIEADRNAVVTAKEMLAAIPRINEAHALPLLDQPVQIRIGVHRGEVIAGNVGATTRMQYGVTGSAVNLANRVMGEAIPGEILISEDVHGFVAAEQDLSFEERGVVELRGNPQPLRLFKVR
jgi:class 3 adenylate cyclase